MKLPPIPTFVHTALGPSPVRRVKQIGRGKTFGKVSLLSRKIQIRKDMSRTQSHQVILHEWVHLALFDAGVIMKPALEERVADVIATALVAGMLASQSTR